MILSDRDIATRLADGSLIIDPLDYSIDPIQPASVDLRLSDCGLSNGTRWINPGEFMLACTLETVHIPADLVAQVNGKSSLGRLGLSVHITAGFIDPGFQGQITLELHNCSQKIIQLPRRMKICQLMLQRLATPAERPYGHPSRKSKYQGQTGVTPSRSERE
jgi:dCTP deaminase